jgi:hypothetical protein
MEDDAAWLAVCVLWLWLLELPKLTETVMPPSLSAALASLVAVGLLDQPNHVAG